MFKKVEKKGLKTMEAKYATYTLISRDMYKRVWECTKCGKQIWIYHNVDIDDKHIESYLASKCTCAFPVKIDDEGNVIQI